MAFKLKTIDEANTLSACRCCWSRPPQPAVVVWRRRPQVTRCSPYYHKDSRINRLLIPERLRNIFRIFTNILKVNFHFSNELKRPNFNKSSMQFTLFKSYSQIHQIATPGHLLSAEIGYSSYVSQFISTWISLYPIVHSGIVYHILWFKYHHNYSPRHHPSASGQVKIRLNEILLNGLLDFCTRRKLTENWGTATRRSLKTASTAEPHHSPTTRQTQRGTEWAAVHLNLL